MRAHLLEERDAALVFRAGPEEVGDADDGPTARLQQLLARYRVARHGQRVGGEVMRPVHLDPDPLLCNAT